jgi:hypothetical protein
MEKASKATWKKQGNMEKSTATMGGKQLFHVSRICCNTRLGEHEKATDMDA